MKTLRYIKGHEMKSNGLKFLAVLLVVLTWLAAPALFFPSTCL